MFIEVTLADGRQMTLNFSRVIVMKDINGGTGLGRTSLVVDTGNGKPMELSVRDSRSDLTKSANVLA